MKNITALFAILLLVGACTKETTFAPDNTNNNNPNNPNNSGPEPKIELIQPVDTFGHEEPVAVNVVFYDDVGLESAEISLGLSGSNAPYYNSQNDLNGTVDKLNFAVEVPPAVNALGENYILIKCQDEQGLETVYNGVFYIEWRDQIEPSVDIMNTYGTLTTDPNIVFDVYFQVRDNAQLQSVNVALEDTAGIDFASQNLSTADSLYRKTVSFSGNSNYVVGSSFRVVLKVTDAGGNENFAYSSYKQIQ